ncbi:hypothetical protein KORDIASMS9_03940 [Kordia sp. SMS9]|uniref:DUF4174 domain-containing protein n=1 Tax=Kordia sp. SMS9 TaxID=2282170 RepID=UPI000E0CDD13|nr:DUF4174 domain-containing protein [Kordia sp. SMS9]AXG71683.1 hypothetical protein KORDIASMS9_03940 [Kordia sp. SMS9]
MMKTKKWTFQTVLILFSFICCKDAVAQDLKNHRWENRVLIIKTFDGTDAQFLAQLAEIKGENKEMMERKFTVYTILGNVFTRIDYKKSKNVFSTDKVSGQLARILDKDELFEVILIGLDGGIKLQQTKVLTKKELFEKVDSMPMRRSELKKN